MRPSWTTRELTCGSGGRTFPIVGCSPIFPSGPPGGGREMALPTVDAPPSHQEGLRVARPTLADVADTGLFDVEWESAAVSKVLADQWLPPSGVPSRPALREYIRRSKGNRAYFDALGHIEATLHDRGKAIPGPLAKWREEVAGGRLRRPALRPVPSHRPANLAQLARDMQIQFTIEVLSRVGVKPNGSDVSGCRIVSNTLGAFRRHRDTHLESAYVETVLRARDAETDEGHRRTQRALHTPEA